MQEGHHQQDQDRQEDLGEVCHHQGGNNVIRKEGNKWVLRTKDGSKVLGRHGTKAQAKRQERKIKMEEAKREG